MHHLTDRITHTMAFVTPVVKHWLEREIDRWAYLFESACMNKTYNKGVHICTGMFLSLYVYR